MRETHTDTLARSFPVSGIPAESAWQGGVRGDSPLLPQQAQEGRRRCAPEADRGRRHLAWCVRLEPRDNIHCNISMLAMRMSGLPAYPMLATGLSGLPGP